MSPPASPYRPYENVHEKPNGPGDARPSSIQVVKDCDKIGALKGRTALITGCSSGLGVETARALYEAGATLFLTARDIPKLEIVIDDIVSKAQYNKEGPRPQAIQMHLDDLTSVRAGAKHLEVKSGGNLNYLILNAGVMASPFTQTKDGFELQIGVNHFAHFLLFKLLTPLLLDSAKQTGTTSRLINLSSAGHRHASVAFSTRAELDAWNAGKDYDKWKGYGSSKTANIWMASSVSRHYAAQGLIGLSVHPGPILTELGRHMSDADRELVGMGQMQRAFKSPEQGAATTVWATVSDHFEGTQGGGYLADVGETGLWKEGMDARAPAYRSHAFDEAKEEQLWNLSLEVLALAQD